MMGFVWCITGLCGTRLKHTRTTVGFFFFAFSVFPSASRSSASVVRVSRVDGASQYAARSLENHVRAEEARDSDRGAQGRVNEKPTLHK